MNHEQAVTLVLDHRAGQLDAGVDAEVAAHIAGCDDCAEILVTYGLLVAACAADPHPSVERLVEYAERQGPADAAVERHVASCASCAAQARAVREAGEEAAGALPFRRPQRSGSATAWRRATYAGAAIAATLVLAVGWLALVRVPDVEGRLAALRDRVASASGAGATVSLPVFRGSLRGGQTPPTIAVGPADLLVPLALTPTLPADLSDTAPQRLELRSADGTIVYSSELDAGEVRRLTADSGALAWLVPAALLADGEYTLSLIDLERHGVVLEQPFGVERRREGEDE